nr:uncharacterized protein LOC129023168 [Pongo pygmaeus]
MINLKAELEDAEDTAQRVFYMVSKRCQLSCQFGLESGLFSPISTLLCALEGTVEGQLTGPTTLRLLTQFGWDESLRSPNERSLAQRPPACTPRPVPRGEKQPRPHGFRCSHGSKRAPALPGAPARRPPAHIPAQPRWPRPQPVAKRRARPVPPGLPGAPKQAALTPGRRPLTPAAFAPKASRDQQVTDSTTICQRGLIEETGPARQISDLCEVSQGVSAFRAGGCPSSLVSSHWSFSVKIPGPLINRRHQDTGAGMQSWMLPSQQEKPRNADADAQSPRSLPLVTRE